MEKVVAVNRSAAVMKGGRRFSFSALVVIGDGVGTVGIGFGKAKEVPAAVEKALKDAHKHKTKVVLQGETIPHRTEFRFNSSRVRLLPASAGTGIIAGPSVRAVLECAGVRNVLSKVYGSTNPHGVVKATLKALNCLRSKEQVEKLRGVTL